MSGSAVVTGAARGIGFEIARRLVDRGHPVVLADLDEDGARAAAERLGDRTVGVACDVRNPSDHARAAEAAVELGGPVTVWVNNAGVAFPGKPWEQSDGDVALSIEVNLIGTVHGCRAAVEAMRSSGGGQIVNIASLAGLGPVPGFGVYAATKAGVVSFTASLQGDLEIAGLPIRAHVLCPDAASTRMVMDVVDDPDAGILFSGSSLLDPADVADAAVALLDSRRIVRAFPPSRGAIVRLGGFAPRVGLKTTRMLRWWGDRHRPPPGERSPAA